MKKVTIVKSKKKNEKPEIDIQIEQGETKGDSKPVDYVVETAKPELLAPANENDYQKELAEILGGDYASEAKPGDMPAETPPASNDLPVKRSRKKAVEPVITPAPKKIIIPGRLVVKLTDTVFSRLITGGDALISKGDAIDPALLRTEPDEMDDLIAMAESMVQSWNIEEHPTLFFFGSMLMIQISNYTMVKALLKKQKMDEKKNDKENGKRTAT